MIFGDPMIDLIAHSCKGLPGGPLGSNNYGSRKNTTRPDSADWTDKCGNDKGSTLNPLPMDEQLVLVWAKAKLGV